MADAATCEHGCYGYPAGEHCGCCARLTAQVTENARLTAWLKQQDWVIGAARRYSRGECSLSKFNEIVSSFDAQR